MQSDAQFHHQLSRLNVHADPEKKYWVSQTKYGEFWRQVTDWNPVTNGVCFNGGILGEVTQNLQLHWFVENLRRDIPDKCNCRINHMLDIPQTTSKRQIGMLTAPEDMLHGCATWEMLWALALHGHPDLLDLAHQRLMPLHTTVTISQCQQVLISRLIILKIFASKACVSCSSRMWSLSMPMRSSGSGNQTKTPRSGNKHIGSLFRLQQNTSQCFQPLLSRQSADFENLPMATVSYMKEAHWPIINGLRFHAVFRLSFYRLRKWTNCVEMLQLESVEADLYF